MCRRCRRRGGLCSETSLDQQSPWYSVLSRLLPPQLHQDTSLVLHPQLRPTFSQTQTLVGLFPVEVLLLPVTMPSACATAQLQIAQWKTQHHLSPRCLRLSSPCQLLSLGCTSTATLHGPVMLSAYPCENMTKYILQAPRNTTSSTSESHHFPSTSHSTSAVLT